MLSLTDAGNSNWLRVAVYLFAACACALTSARSWWRGRDSRAVGAFWLVTATVLTLLALARVIDFGGELANWGRSVFRTEGWYPDRRPVQRDAILGLIMISATLSAAGGAVFVARRWASILPAFLLLMALLTFVAVRAISLHDVDALLYRRSLAHVQFGALVELLVTASIGVVAAVVAASAEFGRDGERARFR